MFVCAVLLRFMLGRSLLAEDVNDVKPRGREHTAFMALLIAAAEF